MKRKSLLVFLTLYSFSVILLAEPETQPKPIAPKAIPLTDNEKDDDEDTVPEPEGMRLITPNNLSLQGSQPVNTTPAAEWQLKLGLTSAVRTNSDVADTALGSSAATDTFFYNGATLSAMPKLGETTRLSANINGGFIRYDGDAVNDYDTLNANLGVFQQLGANMSGDLGWRYAQYYVAADPLIQNPRDLQEQGVRLALRRTDRLPSDFFLNSTYEFQANFSDPVDRSRISNYFTAGLGYYFPNNFKGTVSYGLKHDDYTRRTINDNATRHELQAQVSYQATKYINLAGTVSYLFGESIDLLRNPSSDDAANDLSNLSFGFRIGVNLPLLD
jgi:hypothetical protein